MNKLVRQFLIVCAVLLWTVQHLPAPIVVPEEETAAKPTPKKVKRVVAKPKEHAARKAQPVPTETPVAPAEAPPAATVGVAPGTPVVAPEQLSATQPANSPAAASADPDSLGVTRRLVVKPSENSEIVYTLSATQPFDSKLTGQKFRFNVAEKGVRDIGTDKKKPVLQTLNVSRNTSINTGKTKSLGQLRDLLKDIFQKFTSGTATPGQDLGKIGDARYGGELHFIAESADTMRFDYVPNTSNVIRFSRTDIQKFVELLTQ